MNRRDFLIVLASATVAVPALAMLPQELVPAEIPEALAPWLTGKPRVMLMRSLSAQFEHPDWMWPLSFQVSYNLENESGRCIIEQRFSSLSNTLWVPRPGEEIVYFNDESPIVKCSHERIQWTATLISAERDFAEIVGGGWGGPYAFRSPIPKPTELSDAESEELERRLDAWEER